MHSNIFVLSHPLIFKYSRRTREWRRVCVVARAINAHTHIYIYSYTRIHIYPCYHTYKCIQICTYTYIHTLNTHRPIYSYYHIFTHSRRRGEWRHVCVVWSWIYQKKGGTLEYCLSSVSLGQVCCSVLQRVAVCCSERLLCNTSSLSCPLGRGVAVCCSMLQRVAVCCSESLVNHCLSPVSLGQGCCRGVAVCCIVLQCVAACCSESHVQHCLSDVSRGRVLQCVAGCCSV